MICSCSFSFSRSELNGRSCEAILSVFDPNYLGRVTPTKCGPIFTQLVFIPTVLGLESTTVHFGLEAKVLAHDQDQEQDLIQWQGYRKYAHIAVLESILDTAVFKNVYKQSVHCFTSCIVQFILSQLATAWMMPANSDMTAVDVDKSAYVGSVSADSGSLYLSLKPKSKTELNLSNPVSNQTVLMHLDRQSNLLELRLWSKTKSLYLSLNHNSV